MLDYAIILQDPTERDADAAGHFGNGEPSPSWHESSAAQSRAPLRAHVHVLLFAAFYWFRRGRGGPDRWYDAYRIISRGEYTNGQMDTLAFNHALDSQARIAPITDPAQAALPKNARQRPLSRVFGQAKNLYVVPANKAVVEEKAWKRIQGKGKEMPSFGKRPEREQDEDELDEPTPVRVLVTPPSPQTARRDILLALPQYA